MSHRILLSMVAALTLVASFSATAAPAVAAGPMRGSVHADDLRSAVVYGPYATIRRANEVANEFRRLGFSAIVYHNGDGYYVKVW